MNILDITPGHQIIATIHGQPTTDFPARLTTVTPTDAGTWTAEFLFQPSGQTKWHPLHVDALTTSGPWLVTGTHLPFTVRPERHVTITGLAEQVAWDGVATDEIESAIIAALGMDPRFATGATLLDEGQAERAANEISVMAQ